MLVKRGFFLLNAAFAVAILNFISRENFSLLVVIYLNTFLYS